MRSRTCLALATIACILATPAFADDDALIGSFSISASDKGLKCGGGEEAMSEQGELDPQDINVDPETGLAEFGVDVGGVGARDGNGFGSVGAGVSGTLNLWDGVVEEPTLDGRRNAGWWGKANEQGKLRGNVQLNVARVETPDGDDDTHSVWKLTGTYSGVLLHSGANDSWNDSHEGTGEALGSAQGNFTVYVRARLDDRRNDERFLPLQSGRLYSLHRERVLEPGDRVTEGELIANIGDQAAVVTWPNGTIMHVDPGARICIVKLVERSQPNGPNWYESAVRVVKGMIGAIVKPAPGTADDPELFKFQSVVCCGGVHGTTLQVEANPGWERVTCVEGELWVEHNENEERIALPAGNAVIATEQGLAVNPLSPEDHAAFASAYRNIEANATASQAPTPPQGAAKYVYGVNQYDGEIVGHMTWRQPDGTWHRVDWLLPGGAEGYLEVDGERVVADVLIHWAESRDGKLTWRGDDRETPVDLTAHDGDTHRITYRGAQ